MTIVSGPWVDDLVRRVATTIRVHDEPMPGAWFCGRCPYMNSGVICTKCGAPRWEATPFPGLSESRASEDRP